MIVVFFSQKGGAGKSTFAVYFAVELMLRGFSVIIVDTDPQGSTLRWRTNNNAKGTLTPHVVGVGEGEDVIASLLSFRERADFVIVDTKGEVTRRSTDALAVADLAVLPCRPSPLDLDALPDTLDAAVSMKAARPGFEARVLINEKFRTRLSRGYEKGIKTEAEKFGVPLFRTEIDHGTTYQEAHSLGLGVTAYKPKSKEAETVRALVDEILRVRQEVPHVA